VPASTHRIEAQQPIHREGSVLKIIVASVATACVAVMFSLAEPAAASAQDNLPLSPLAGTYMQNVVCKGNGKDPAALRVVISSQQIISNTAVCKVLDSKQEGKSVAVHVECKFPAGPLIGNIKFTQRANKTIKFVDKDNNYNAVLHPCPN
jgi:hypothetical protein